ncbi:MAG: DUF1579 domain-containing protein [Thermoanaerobaculia bacterium]|nr:DUF1579 domain-containing protein [Thermoanaerobaculia bacterium]
MKACRTPTLIILASMLFLGSTTAGAQTPDQANQATPTGEGSVDLAAMMNRAREFTAPGEHHQLLSRFLGTWDTEFRITMMPNQPAEKGEATFGWLVDGRWLKQESTGTLMGQPMQAFMILGYDNFKQSYVTATVGSVDTALLTSEGDLDPGGEVLITYGTLDEYLTGEHDKMVKYVWRFHSEDRMTMEVHDLPIGEKNTQVIEVTYTRKSES